MNYTKKNPVKLYIRAFPTTSCFIINKTKINPQYVGTKQQEQGNQLSDKMFYLADTTNSITHRLKKMVLSFYLLMSFKPALHWLVLPETSWKAQHKWEQSYFSPCSFIMSSKPHASLFWLILKHFHSPKHVKYCAQWLQSNLYLHAEPLPLSLSVCVL